MTNRALDSMTRAEKVQWHLHQSYRSRLKRPPLRLKAGPVWFRRRTGNSMTARVSMGSTFAWPSRA